MICRTMSMLAAVVAIATLELGCASMSGETKVQMSDAPAAVRASIQRVAGDRKVELTREREDNQTFYEAEYEVDGMDRSIKLNTAGEIVEEENEVAASSLPAAVTESLNRKYPSANVHEAYMVKEGGKSYYEIEVMSGGKKREVKLGTDGSMMGDETMKD